MDTNKDSELIVEAMARAAYDARKATIEQDPKAKVQPWEVSMWQEPFRGDMRAALTALYAKLEELGWVVLPRDPTSDMRLAAGCMFLPTYMGHWHAMLSAAPKPPGAA